MLADRQAMNERKEENSKEKKYFVFKTKLELAAVVLHARQN